MGAKYWFAVYSDDDPKEHLKKLPEPDEVASAELAKQLFDCEMIATGTEPVDLWDPRGKDVLVGVYPGVTIVAAEQLAIDNLSQIDNRFLDNGKTGRVTLHAQHSVVDWAAFAWWENGSLKRAFSASPDSGIIEDIGDRLPFESSFWEPEEEMYDEDADFPYGHPLDLGEDALSHFIGTQFEGELDKMLWDTGDLKICKFRKGRRRKPIWKFWA